MQMSSSSQRNLIESAEQFPREGSRSTFVEVPRSTTKLVHVPVDDNQAICKIETAPRVFSINDRSAGYHSESPFFLGLDTVAFDGWIGVVRLDEPTTRSLLRRSTSDADATEAGSARKYRSRRIISDRAISIVMPAFEIPEKILRRG